MTDSAPDNVVMFNGASTLDLDPDRLLKAAVGKLKAVVILGYTEEGHEYYAASKADPAETIFHLERCKHNLMKQIDDMADGVPFQ